MFSKRNKRRIHKAATHYICTHHSKADNDFQAAMNIAAYKAFVAGCEYVYNKFINNKSKENDIMEEEKTKDFVMTHPDADFIGYIKVGNRGVPEYYTDKSKYEARLDKVWDSGFDFTTEVIKNSNH